MLTSETKTSETKEDRLQVPLAFLVAGGLVTLMMTAIRPYAATLPADTGSIFAVVNGIMMSVVLTSFARRDR